MSSMPCNDSDTQPDWFWDLLDATDPASRDKRLQALGLQLRDGIVRTETEGSETQAQTERTFGFKWQKRDTYESAGGRARMREWLERRYGEPRTYAFLEPSSRRAIVLDAGCGAGYSALELFGDTLENVCYLGVDVSDAVDVARTRFAERGLDGAAFMQADITQLPIPDASVDAVFSEGVMHHTDSTQAALTALARKIRPGGSFMFYVYRRKGPIREFTDDYIRDRLQDVPPDEAWAALEPLSQLGQALGELDVEVEIPESIDLLQIPAGRISVQRLFYWHVFKAFYRPDMTLDEMNHINFDWYAPRNAHRQSIDEVRAWCAEAGLDIERERVEDAGITVVARKRSS